LGPHVSVIIHGARVCAKPMACPPEQGTILVTRR
jgi:hypothetical protein